MKLIHSASQENEDDEGKSGFLGSKLQGRDYNSNEERSSRPGDTVCTRNRSDPDDKTCTLA